MDQSKNRNNQQQNQQSPNRQKETPNRDNTQQRPGEHNRTNAPLPGKTGNFDKTKK